MCEQRAAAPPAAGDPEGAEAELARERAVHARMQGELQRQHATNARMTAEMSDLLARVVQHNLRVDDARRVAEAARRAERRIDLAEAVARRGPRAPGEGPLAAALEEYARMILDALGGARPGGGGGGAR